MTDRQVLCGIYEHYKSTPALRRYYLVQGLAHHSETEEEMVVYVPLYTHDENGVPLKGPRMAVRPADMFFGVVDEICSWCRSDFTVPTKDTKRPQHFCYTCGRFYTPEISRFVYVGSDLPKGSKAE